MNRKLYRHSPLALVAAVVSIGLLSSPALRDAAAVTLNVAIDTSALNGTAAQLAFDFIDGDAAVNNTVSISGFLSPGAVGSPFTSGGATGTLPAPVTVTDTDFLNELLQPVTLGASLSFALDATTNFAGGLPDAFSFFILNSAGTDSLVITTDSTGSNALFRIDLVGPPKDIERFEFSGETVAGAPVPVSLSAPVAAIPEPGTELKSA